VSGGVFVVQVDSELVELAALSSKTDPKNFIASAVASAILDALDGGSVHVACDDAGITASMDPDRD
jgi:hypothetical protein